MHLSSSSTEAAMDFGVKVFAVLCCGVSIFICHYSDRSFRGHTAAAVGSCNERNYSGHKSSFAQKATPSGVFPRTRLKVPALWHKLVHYRWKKTDISLNLVPPPPLLKESPFLLRLDIYLIYRGSGTIMAAKVRLPLSRSRHSDLGYIGPAVDQTKRNVRSSILLPFATFPNNRWGIS